MDIGELITEIQKAKRVCIKLGIDWETIPCDYVPPKNTGRPE
jgi:hypothetical protein